jgi:RNA-directed DNA polymerase
LQTKLNYIFQLIYKAKPCVHGFVRDRSILTNAAPHAGKRWVLNVDLQDFFPTIHFGRVRGALMARPFSLPKRVATVLAQVCSSDGVLPQGAPTSPVLANIVCAKLDGDLMALARRFKLSYTRYCDDLTFSSRHHSFPSDVAVGASGWVGRSVILGPALHGLLEANGFPPNVEKTRLQLHTCHQEVTGLTVNDFLNVSRLYIRGLRGMLYAWRRHGLANAATTFVTEYSGRAPAGGAAEQHFRSVLRGRIEHVGMVRGRTDPIYCKLRAALHSLEPSLIGPAPPPSPYPMPLLGRGGERWPRLFTRWTPTVFHLEIVATNGRTGSGTAFAMFPGVLATAAHNLEGAVTCHLLASSIPLVEAHLHARGASEIDAALVPCQHGAATPPFERRIPEPGEQIAIIGFASVPFRHPGLGLYVGSVETLRANYSRTLTLVQISVASAGGLSGSPAFDATGRLVGMVIESVFEQVGTGVPGREYCTILPIQHILDIDRSAPAMALPISD